MASFPLRVALLDDVAFGVVEWPTQADRITVVAKTTHSLSDGRFADVQQALTEETPCPLSESPNLLHPSDWVPFKKAVDLLLVGHARSGAERSCWPVSIGLGPFHRTAFVVVDHPASLCPLGSSAIRSGPRQDQGLAQLGPVAPLPHNPGEVPSYQYAPAQQRIDELPLGEWLVLSGLLGTGEPNMVALPAHSPTLMLCDASGRSKPIPLRADTLWINTDEGIMTIAWRALCADLTAEEYLVITREGRSAWDQMRARIKSAKWLSFLGTADEDADMRDEPTATMNAIPFLEEPARSDAEIHDTQAIDGNALLNLEALPFRGDSEESSSQPVRRKPDPLRETLKIKDKREIFGDALPFTGSQPPPIKQPSLPIQPPPGPIQPPPGPIQPPSEPSVSAPTPVRPHRFATLKISRPEPPGFSVPSAEVPKENSPPPSSAPSTDRDPPLSAEDTRLLDLDDYASIKAALMHTDKTPAEVFAEHGIDETLWRLEESRRADALSEAARSGNGGPVVALRNAMRRAISRLGSSSN